MRLLPDMNMPRSIARLLRARGHDAVHLGEIGLGRLADNAIFMHAKVEGRIVVTFDLDFDEIAGIAGDTGCAVMLLRLRSVRAAHVLARLEVALAQAGVALAAAPLALSKMLASGFARFLDRK